jgi:two-component system, NtrC family, response regulator GlrR
MTDKLPPLNTSLGFGLRPVVKPSRSAKVENSAAPLRKPRILIVDSDPQSRRFMMTRLGLADYAVDAVDAAQAALDACVRSRPNLVITDLRLEPMDGMALLRELKSRWPTMTVIIVTAHGTIPEAVEATQAGAFGFLVKPVDKEELLGQVARAVEASTFTAVEGDWRAGIVSRSQLMEDRLSLANRAAASDAPVLLTGENGTGKELLARAIHAASPHREQSFTVVQCADAVPESIAVVTAGQGGTVLLDEVGDLTPSLQRELANALQNAPPGAARLISTTARSLTDLVAAGRFRQDLYYLLAVLPIEIPPLGRRREDIPLLVSHFLGQATEADGRRKIYSAEAIELLATSDWPGNVKQLFDLVKLNVALSHDKIMTKEFVEKTLGRDATPVPGYDEARDNFAREYLRRNLQLTAGNVSQAARLAKRNRTDFYKLLTRYSLAPDQFKQEHPAAGEPPPAKRSGGG